MDYSSPVTTALINNAIGGNTQASLVKEVKCEICNLMVSSYVSFVYFLLLKEMSEY